MDSKTADKFALIVFRIRIRIRFRMNSVADLVTFWIKELIRYICLVDMMFHVE